MSILARPTRETEYWKCAYKIRLVDGHILKASLEHDDGLTWSDDEEIDLNTCIGNIEGKFTWGEKNFWETAKDIWLGWNDPTRKAPRLVASLMKSDGTWTAPQRLNLTPRIVNNNGKFEYNVEHENEFPDKDWDDEDE